MKLLEIINLDIYTLFIIQAINTQIVIKFLSVKNFMKNDVSHIILGFAIFSIRFEDLEITGILDPAHGHIQLTVGKEIILKVDSNLAQCLTLGLVTEKIDS